MLNISDFDLSVYAANMPHKEKLNYCGKLSSVTQLAQSLPKHYQTTKNPSKRYQEILQLPNHYQVATIFGVICD